MKSTIKYEKVMTRDAPLILIVAWYKAFKELIPQVFEFKIKFPEPIYIFKNGTVESWRATESFFGQLPETMSQWVREAKNTKRILDEFDRYIKIGKALKTERPKSIKNLKSQEAVKEIKRICDLFMKGTAGLIPAYWCVTWNEGVVKQNKIALFPQKILKKATGLRKNDTLFDDAADLIYEYLYMIAKERHWPKNLMKFFLFEELSCLVLKGKTPDFRKIQKRQDGYAYFSDKLFLAGEFSAALKSHGYVLAGELMPKRSQLIKGASANPGKARGKVKVVLNREQLDKINSGDILVSPMTTPSFLPAMIKAAAFVTDEGGVICHAAIVAREMKKPCIIGTRIATKVLKDGDLVEVDAINGIVKKL